MIDRVLSVVDGNLPWLFVSLGVVGFFTTFYAMTLTGYEDEDGKDPVWVQWFRRISYALIAFGMIFSSTFQLNTQWHPWPPAVALMLGINIMMGLRIVAIKLRIRREGHRESSMSYSRNGNGLSRQKR